MFSSRSETRGSGPKLALDDAPNAEHARVLEVTTDLGMRNRRLVLLPRSERNGTERAAEEPALRPQRHANWIEMVGGSTLIMKLRIRYLVEEKNLVCVACHVAGQVFFPGGRILAG